MPVLDPVEELAVVGQACVLLGNLEKSFDIGEGHLVPWAGDSTLLIDRYDCRAHLTDLSEFESPISLDPEDYLSEDELILEKMCEFERYLELRVDVDEMVTQSEEEKKRELEKARNQYSAVGFSYDQENDAEETYKKAETPGTAAEQQPASPEVPYTCPSDLTIPEGVELPETDKQAQIIERTAVFVARQGNQMEIILKAKQTNNPFFSFLNYDHKLNPFYKEVVKLIRSGRYIPKARPPKIETDAEIKFEPNKSIHEDVYELKLPKVDISNTAYASLINKFKKLNEAAVAAANTQRRNSPIPDSQPSETEKQTDTSPVGTSDTPLNNCIGSQEAITDENAEIIISKPPVMNVTATPDVPSETASASTVSNTTLTEEYEQCYQEYYKHYYAHYYTQYSEQQAKVLGQPCSAFSEEQRSAIVQQAAKAAAVAASAAVNAMYQAGIKQKSHTEAVPVPSMTTSEKGIIDKMAEYVMRNGSEFEELVMRQKGSDPRFGFLKPGHPLHSYYQSRKQSTITEHSQDEGELQDSKNSTSFTKDDLQNGHSDIQEPENSYSEFPEKDLPKERQASISFRLSRPNSSNKIRSTTPERTGQQHTTGLPHPPQPADVHMTTSCPVLTKQDQHSRSPQTPANSLASTEDAPNGRSPSPVKFSLPGIPCASDTSSTESSPRSNVRSASSSPTKSPYSPVPSVSTHFKNAAWDSPPTNSLRDISRCLTASKAAKLNTSPPAKDRWSPKTTHNLTTHSPTNTNEVRKQVSPSKSWGSSAIEEMLGLADHLSSKERSPDPSSLHHAAQKVLDERLREERRKRAAQLVARLKSSTSDAHMCGSNTDGVSSHQSVSADAPPPPPPDSVPAAVAHAVVASLKRRQEESLASMEAEAKARKRARSPPAAYALPKDRSHKSSKHSRRTRHSPSPDSFNRARNSSSERSYSKHSKHRKSKH